MDFLILQSRVLPRLIQRAALEKLGQPVGLNDMGEFARVPALEAGNWIHTAQ